MTEHEHCWHGTGEAIFVDPPLTPEYCCWCGEVRVRSAYPGRLGRHGHYLSPRNPHAIDEAVERYERQRTITIESQP